MITKDDGMDKKDNFKILKTVWNYLIRTSGLMALGLFSTLIVGTIIFLPKIIVLI